MYLVLKLLSSYIQASIIGTPHRNANRASYIIDSIDTELPIDLWEISPDNVVMDETTFFGCGNFGEVYKGYLKTATKSPSESYPAGRTVAVKILQGTYPIFMPILYSRKFSKDLIFENFENSQAFLKIFSSYLLAIDVIMYCLEDF